MHHVGGGEPCSLLSCALNVRFMPQSILHIQALNLHFLPNSLIYVSEYHVLMLLSLRNLSRLLDSDKQILIPTLQPCSVQPDQPERSHPPLSVHSGLCGFGFGPECRSVVSRCSHRLNETEARFPSGQVRYGTFPLNGARMHLPCLSW